MLAERAAAVAAAVDALLAEDLTAASDEAVLAAARVVESARRRLGSFDLPLVAELDRRPVVGRELAPSVAAFLSRLLNVSPREARQRVRQARALGSRPAISGAVLPPVRPVLAEARQSGSVNEEHVEVVLRTLHRLPSAMPTAVVEKAEASLTDWASRLDPAALRPIAARLLATLDPDGRLTDAADHYRRRCLQLVPLGDGMHRLTGDLDPAAAALAGTVLNALSAPQPTEAGGPDQRSAAQRRHDALVVVLKQALRAGQLPQSGGVPATVLISLTAAQLTHGQELAETSTGQQLTVAQALRLAGQAELALLFADATGRPLNLYRNRRLASPSQTLALIARDNGCTFPGCTMPPEWTEKHHVVPWRNGGLTNLDNLALVCDYHHDHHLREGWRIQMRRGQPYWLPPAWKDPEQKPIRNHHFHPPRT
jgi:Domain of unknown function (DUF222)/HNH endonuclease